jgi:hypothetical protein
LLSDSNQFVFSIPISVVYTSIAARNGRMCASEARDRIRWGFLSSFVLSRNRWQIDTRDRSDLERLAFEGDLGVRRFCGRIAECTAAVPVLSGHDLSLNFVTGDN